jgi:hypothetical protein
MRSSLNEAVGNYSLCAWLVAPGVTWVQTREPKFARKLSQRADSHLVARGVAGGYLRTFAFRHGMAWARRLISRYTQNEMATGMGINPLPCPIEPSHTGGSIRTRTEPADSATPTNARKIAPVCPLRRETHEAE